MSNFKVGDKVKVVGESWTVQLGANYGFTGDIGTVEEVEDSSIPFKVTFGDPEKYLWFKNDGSIEIVKEDMTNKTKISFNLELFKQGHKAVTRDGREADFIKPHNHSKFNLEVSVDGTSAYLYTSEGSYWGDEESDEDLLYMQDNQEIIRPSPEPKPMKIKPKQTVLYQSIKAKLKPHDKEKWKEVKKELKQVIKSPNSTGFSDDSDLSVAFDWDSTFQGCEYWDDVYIILNKIENNDEF